MSVIRFLLEVIMTILFFPIFLLSGIIIATWFAAWALWMCIKLIIYIIKS